LKNETNRFGTGILYQEEDVEGSIYAVCTACMSIYSEFLSFAQANKPRMVGYIDMKIDADNVVLLGCQVTDLAVLNDLVELEFLMKKHPSKQFYVGGCLARRFDIELPKGVKRLNNIKRDYQVLHDYELVNWINPFWVKDYNPMTIEGNLFRFDYPIRIGVGCNGSCSYCTIKVTRGENYLLDDYSQLEREFLAYPNTVLIADSPTKDQLLKWCDVSIKNNKPISIRNVEPHVAMEIMPALIDLSQKKLLSVFHSPIQSTNEFILKDMKRNSAAVFELLEAIGHLNKQTYTATNIIIDYKDILHTDPDHVLYFDYVSWNPYWDGVWDRKKAEDRFKHYFGG